MANVWTLAKQGKSGELRSLISSNRAFANQAEPGSGKTPLFFACESGNLETVKLLLENGADPNAVNSNNQSTPLHTAAFYGNGEIVTALLNARANPNVFNSNRLSPLHSACDNGHVTAVEALVKHGCNLQLADKNGVTALHYAVAKGHASLVELLCQKGANVNAVDNLQQTPFVWAMKSNNLKQVGELLKKYGAKTDVTDSAIDLQDDAKFRRMLGGMSVQSVVKQDDTPVTVGTAPSPRFNNPAPTSSHSTTPTPNFSTPNAGSIPTPDFGGSPNFPSIPTPSFGTNSPVPAGFNNNNNNSTPTPTPTQSQPTPEPDIASMFPDAPKQKPGTNAPPPKQPTKPLSPEEQEFAMLYGHKLKSLYAPGESPPAVSNQRAAPVDRFKDPLLEESSSSGGKKAGSMELNKDKIAALKAKIDAHKKEGAKKVERSGVVKEGKLWLPKGAIKVEFKPFHCVLKESTLEVYESENSEVANLIIYLASNSTLEDVGEKGKLLRFNLSTNKKNHKFEADNREDKISWILAMNKQIQAIKSGQVSPAQPPTTVKQPSSPNNNADKKTLATSIGGLFNRNKSASPKPASPVPTQQQQQQLNEPNLSDDENFESVPDLDQLEQSIPSPDFDESEMRKMEQETNQMNDKVNQIASRLNQF